MPKTAIEKNQPQTPNTQELLEAELLYPPEFYYNKIVQLNLLIQQLSSQGNVEHAKEILETMKEAVELQMLALKTELAIEMREHQRFIREVNEVEARIATDGVREITSEYLQHILDTEKDLSPTTIKFLQSMRKIYEKNTT